MTQEELERWFARCEEQVQKQRPRELMAFTELLSYRDLVLPRELETLHARSGVPEMEQRPEVLVLLCGNSPAPLLLSYSFHQPAKVLLVGSYSPPEEGRPDLGVPEVLRGCLPHSALLPDLLIHESQPLVAYQELYLRLRDLPGERALVDLTGSKKTMMIAAFLVAARLGLKMTYVDATETSAVLRLPWPGSSFVRTVEDPITVYRLHELEQARRLFGERRFSAAERLYLQIAVDLRRAQLTALVDPAALDAAAARARGAAAWREANYPQAVAEFTAAGVTPPAAVAALARLWHTYPSDEERHLLLSIKESGQGLLTFVADRLAWALRLRGDDARAAFIGGFQACDTALEGLCMSLAQRGLWPAPAGQRTPPGRDRARELRSDQLLREATKAGWLRHGHAGLPALGEPYRRFVQVGPPLGPRGEQREELREHRNILIHRIGAPHKPLVDKLLQGSPCLAEALVRAIGDALPLAPGVAGRVIDAALADLELRGLKADLPAEDMAR